MLRLIKRYKFGYHMTGLKNSSRVLTRSIVMSSYPGALSSQDEYYILNGEKTTDVTVLAGTPLVVQTSIKSWNSIENSKELETSGRVMFNDHSGPYVITSAKIMAANWLTSDIYAWSRVLNRYDVPGSVFRPLQWVIVRAVDMSIWLVEQHSEMKLNAVEYTRTFKDKGILFCDGTSLLINHENDESELLTELPIITGIKEKKRISRAAMMKEKYREWMKKIEEPEINSPTDNHEAINQTNDTYIQNLSSKLLDETPEWKSIMNFRGDLRPIPMAIGTIDSKLSLVHIKGISRFEASSGPVRSERDIPTFEWSKIPKMPHIGHPEKFYFKTMIPNWVWF